MPLRKKPKEVAPLWREWDHKAQKSGQRHTVYWVSGDQFTGEWADNRKNGKHNTHKSKFIKFYKIRFEMENKRLNSSFKR